MQLKLLLEDIESRSSRKEYVHILSECHRLYCEQRFSLVSWWFIIPFFICSWLFDRKLMLVFHAIQIRGIVHQRISEFAKKEALPSLTRSGCAYLMQVLFEITNFSISFWRIKYWKFAVLKMDYLSSWIYLLLSTQKI